MPAPETAYYRQLLTDRHDAYVSVAEAQAANPIPDGEFFSRACVKVMGDVHYYRFIRDREGKVTATLDKITQAHQLTDAYRKAIQAEGIKALTTLDLPAPWEPNA